MKTYLLILAFLALAISAPSSAQLTRDTFLENSFSTLPSIISEEGEFNISFDATGGWVVRSGDRIKSRGSSFTLRERSDGGEGMELILLPARIRCLVKELGPEHISELMRDYEKSSSIMLTYIYGELMDGELLVLFED